MMSTTMAAAKPETRERHRLQFEFSPEAYQQLNSVKEKANASSYAELVRDALRVYEWVLDQQKEGYEIALLKEGKPVKIIQLVL